MANQLGRQPGQPIHLILGPAIFDRHALALDIASILEALAEWAEKILTGVRRSWVKEPDHRQCRLLCPCRKRPRRRRAADVACHVTLRLGAIHAMEGLYHALDRK